MRNVIICDLDHVVSDASWRDHLLGQWDEYHALLVEDKLCEDVACLLESFRVACFYIIGITARPERVRAQTQKWLLAHRIPMDEILMRGNEDFRPAGELKLALAKERFGNDLTKEVLCVIDDNEEVIRAFQAEGLTCLMCYGRTYQ